MPLKPPDYSVPEFDGESTNPGQAMADWVTQFGQSWNQTQTESERLPYIVSTFTNSSFSNPKSNFLSKQVQFQGGEQVQVSGFFAMDLKASVNLSSVSASNSAKALGRLKVTYPGGTTESRSTHQAAIAQIGVAGKTSSTAGVVTGKSTVSSETMVSFTWPIETRFQTGGTHTFTLFTEGDGSVNGGTLTIQVF